MWGAPDVFSGLADRNPCRLAARDLGEAHKTGRWGVARDPHLSEGWRACASEANLIGGACSRMGHACRTAAELEPKLLQSPQPLLEDHVIAQTCTVDDP